jgi:hypothetical protein
MASREESSRALETDAECIVRKVVEEAEAEINQKSLALEKRIREFEEKTKSIHERIDDRVFQLTKHLSTLATGSLLLLAAFTDRFSSVRNQHWEVRVVLWGSLLALALSVLSLYGQCFRGLRPLTDDSRGQKLAQRFAFCGIVGIAFFVAAMVNLALLLNKAI